MRLLVASVLCLAVHFHFFLTIRAASLENSSVLVRLPIPKNLPIGSNFTTWITASGRAAFLVTTTLPVFQVLYDPGKLHRISASRFSSGCEFAVNGGPFKRDGTAVGLVVSNATVLTNDVTGSDNNGFGITRDGMFYVLGNIAVPEIDDDDDDPINDLQEFVTGFDWLVYNGTARVGNNTTGALRAPRTVIGLDSQGRLLLLVVDGCEFCFRHQGPTLQELADLMITKALAQWAVNMDGGGSSALAHYGRLLNRPLPWERPVATIICVDSHTTSRMIHNNQHSSLIHHDPAPLESEWT